MMLKKYFLNGKTVFDLAFAKENMKIHDILLKYKKNDTTTDSQTKSSNCKSKISATVRGDDVPAQLVHDGHIYKFYYSTKDSHVYSFKYGIDHHKTNKIKCNAKISIPNPINFDDFHSIPVQIIDSNHTCLKKTDEIKRIISNSFLKTKVEEIFMNEPSRPTRQQLITKLYEFIDKTTPEGEEKQTFSEQLVNNYYTELVKKYKQNDTDFTNVLKTSRNDNFELFKYRFSVENSSSLIICYCSNFQRECISLSRFIFIDGTFNIAPKDFAQVLVILGQTNNMNLPLAYFLLPDKRQSTYEKAFIMFKNETKASFYPGATFVTDFEKGEYKAVKKCLMDEDHYLQLCYFHFVQSMRRYFQKNQKSQILSELNSIANLLPFISEQKVVNVIHELYKYDVTKKFAKYFEDNYLNKYSFDDWSVYTKPRKETITNNVAESHNNILAKRIGPQPSLKKFEATLIEIEKEYYYRYENRKYTTPETLRIDEDLFDEKYRNFLSRLRRFNSTDNIQEDNFFDISESELFKYSDDIDTSDAELNKIANSLSETSDSLNNPINDDINEAATVSKTFETNLDDVDDETIVLEKVNTRKLSKKGKQILINNSKIFSQAPPRSIERRQILESTFNDLQPIEPNIDKNQIRTWFYNNKSKSSDL